MDSTGIYDLFRSEVRDEEEPYLWTKDEVFMYLDDAQKMFCRLQGGISDASSSITTLSVDPGDVFLPISPRILKLREARRGLDGRVVEILNFEDLPSVLTNTPGSIRAVVVGMEVNKIRLIDIPTDAQKLNLVVYRLPLNDITNAGSQSLEIDTQHHIALIDWMKNLAHRKQDAETYDRGRADEFKASFVAYCDQAKAEREKREHKYRTIAYGGY